MINNMEKIYCFGDSHCNIFREKNTPFIDIFEVYHVGPALAYSLCKEGTKTGAREKILDKLLDIPKDNYLMFCFGEIDCRLHLFKQSNLQKKTIKRVIYKCVKRYISFLKEIKNKGYRVIVFGPIATTWTRKHLYNQSRSIVGTEEERNKITLEFNECLGNKCEEENIIFISIFLETIKNEYKTNRKLYSKDECHLKVKRKKVFSLILKEINDKIPDFYYQIENE